MPEPEFYDMRADIEERHNVAPQHAGIVRRMLDLAEQRRADLGDTTLNRKGAGVCEPGRIPE